MQENIKSSNLLHTHKINWYGICLPFTRSECTIFISKSNWKWTASCTLSHFIVYFWLEWLWILKSLIAQETSFAYRFVHHNSYSRDHTSQFTHTTAEEGRNNTCAFSSAGISIVDALLIWPAAYCCPRISTYNFSIFAQSWINRVK